MCTETGPYLATDGREQKNKPSQTHQITEELILHSRICHGPYIDQSNGHMPHTKSHEYLPIIVVATDKSD